MAVGLAISAAARGQNDGARNARPQAGQGAGISSRCAATLNPWEAFNATDGFEKFFRECYLSSVTPSIELSIVSIGWISPYPNPFEGTEGGTPSWLRAQTGPALAAVLSPQWVPRVYMGLIATSNPPPPNPMDGLATFRKSRMFRSMLGARIRLQIDPLSGAPQASISDRIIDGGYTPPFDRNRFLGTYPPSWFPGPAKDWTGIQGAEALGDSAWYKGQASKASAIVAGRHPNSALQIPRGERVLVNGLIRFRAGEHTDAVGVQVGSPYHVPWVWSEFAITFASGKFVLYGLASPFPTTWWYLDGERVHCQARLSDADLPIRKGTITNIDLTALSAYPALSTGAPTTGDQVEDDRPSGPIDQQPYTLAAARGGQWRQVLEYQPNSPSELARPAQAARRAGSDGPIEPACR